MYVVGVTSFFRGGLIMTGTQEVKFAVKENINVCIVTINLNLNQN